MRSKVVSELGMVSEQDASLTIFFCFRGRYWSQHLRTTSVIQFYF